MSYIKKSQREFIEHSPIGSCGNLSPDEVSYAVMAIIKQNLEGKSPSEFNAYLGAISKAEREIYRKYVIPYENQQQFDNGDL